MSALTESQIRSQRELGDLLGADENGDITFKPLLRCVAVQFNKMVAMRIEYVRDPVHLAALRAGKEPPEVQILSLKPEVAVIVREQLTRALDGLVVL